MSGPVAVVGGGAAGLLASIALLRRGASVRLYGDAATLGRGYAYGPAAGPFLLNARADRLGVEEDHPEGFADWLGLRGGARHGFRTRAEFGAYLQHQLMRRQRELAARFETVERQVVAAEASGSGWRLRDETGESLPAAALVLALGGVSCWRPAAVTRAAFAAPGYVAEPLRDGALQRVPRDARVLLLGTGLTMVDAALGLLRGGHRGPLRALSRHALRPQRHADGTPAAPLRDWCDATLSPDAHSVRALFRRFRREVARGADWRALIDGLRANTSALWRSLPVLEQQRFRRHLAALWNVHRHRTPPALADELDDAIDSGQLQLQRGRLRALATQDGGFRAHVDGSEGAGTLEVDVVLQCFGSEGAEACAPSPLLVTLREAGWVRPHPSGIGLDVDDHQRLRGECEGPRCYALGALCRGADPDQVAIPELRAAAATLARDWSGAA